MTSNWEDRLAGVVLAALFTALAGDLLGVPLLVKISVPSFFLATASLLAFITVTKLVEAVRSSGPDMHDPTRTDETE